MLHFFMECLSQKVTLKSRLVPFQLNSVAKQVANNKRLANQKLIELRIYDGVIGFYHSFDSHKSLIMLSFIVIFLMTCLACQVSQENFIRLKSCKRNCFVYIYNGTNWDLSLTRTNCLSGVIDSGKVFLATSRTGIAVMTFTDHWQVESRYRTLPINGEFPKLAIHQNYLFVTILDYDHQLYGIQVVDLEKSTSTIIYPSAILEDACGEHLFVNHQYLASLCLNDSGDSIVVFKKFGSEWIRFSITSVEVDVINFYVIEDRLIYVDNYGLKHSINLDLPILKFD